MGNGDEAGDAGQEAWLRGAGWVGDWRQGVWFVRSY